MVTAIAFFAFVTGCANEYYDPPADNVETAEVQSFQAEIVVDGGGLSDLSINGLVVGADFHHSSDVEMLTVNVAATHHTIATVAASDVVPVTMTAHVNGVDVSDQVYVGEDFTMAGRVVSGIIIELQVGDQLEVSYSGGTPSLEGVVLTSDPSTFMFDEVRSDVEAAVTTDGDYATAQLALSLPSWLKNWARNAASKGVACWVVQEFLEDRGATCPEKPWWFPNALCIWQITMCYHTAY